MLSQHQQDTGSREDLQTQPNLCFSDFRFPERAEFTEYVFHLGKTPMFILLYFQERNDKNQRKLKHRRYLSVYLNHHVILPREAPTKKY